MGVGKSHLRKTIHKVVSKLLQYHGNSPEKSWVFILTPIWVVGGQGGGSINVNGTITQSSFHLACHGRLYSLDAMTTDTFQNKFYEVQLVIIDKISVVSKKILCQIHTLLIEIFTTS